MKNRKNNKKKGFTLIEILVAVIIIGVLAAIALPSYMRSMEKSKAANPITNLGSIAKAQNAYKLGTSHYTNNVGKLDISLKDNTNGEDADGSTFESEYFTYKVYGDDKAAATATRKNVDEDKIYELSVDYNTNKIYCRPIENKTCIDLNLEEGQDYNPQEDDSDWPNCSDNLSAIAAMIGESTEDIEAALPSLNYCKFKDGKLKMGMCEQLEEETAAIVGASYYCMDMLQQLEQGGFSYQQTECYSIDGETCYEYVAYGESEMIDNGDMSMYCEAGNMNQDHTCDAYDYMHYYKSFDNGAYLNEHCMRFNGLECLEWERSLDYLSDDQSTRATCYNDHIGTNGECNYYDYYSVDRIVDGGHYNGLFCENGYCREDPGDNSGNLACGGPCGGVVNERGNGCLTYVRESYAGQCLD